MKKIFSFLFFVLFIFIFLYYFSDELKTLYYVNFNDSSSIKLDYKNEYTRNIDFNYVKNIDDFVIKDKKQIINVYYTIINSGIDEFSIYCSSKYKECINDLNSVAQDNTILSSINSYIHPYNGFNSIETQYDVFGKVTIKVNRNYTKNDIDKINYKISTIMDDVNKYSNDKDKIKYIHDYIISHSKTVAADDKETSSKYHVDSAYGPLIEGYGLCKGYTDAMSIFLDILNIPNFNIISEKHTWNVVYIDNKWYHLDLTWDDPIMSDGSDIIDYNYYLISTKELNKKDSNEHNYDKSIFTEVK